MALSPSGWEPVCLTGRSEFDSRQCRQAGVAQMVERLPSKQNVVGSMPSIRSKFKRGLIMETLRRAVLFATEAHQDQIRKWLNVPYIIHPLNVMRILRLYNVTNEDTLCAAVLHDIIEDCGITYDEIREKFGANVATSVMLLTKDDEITDKIEQIRDQIVNLQQATMETRLIKIADIMDNAEDALFGDVNFRHKFGFEKKFMLNEIRKSLSPVDWIFYEAMLQRAERLVDKVIESAVVFE